MTYYPVECEFQDKSAEEITAEIREFRQAHPEITDIVVDQEALMHLFDAFATRQQAEPSNILLTDRMRDTFYSSGKLPDFMGLNWISESAQS